jgi:transposase
LDTCPKRVFLSEESTRVVNPVQHASLVGDRAAVKASIHAVLGKCGVIPEISDIFGPVGSKMLDALVLPEPYGSRVASQRRIMATLSTEIAGLEVETVRRLKDNPEYRALLTINGVGPVMAAIFVAEIGDVHRFATADQSCAGSGPARAAPGSPAVRSTRSPTGPGAADPPARWHRACRSSPAGPASRQPHADAPR